ncbi:hypothetical protein C7M61_000611 [Candidozyma pseudohaemuli]|uniref:non-specific serine/threonine protein kinase n=1 Tax=Candidozyma pseudohaemuli TaxID=418784 RepID=A0A2P7YY99_9ASCO|nr:hypothetical protein C7M61_000611 [[Candida] pseudohaemulonii]PSK40945.1 hypothetical protein C7M61_000611 [[Candida] pseudohaemulonii]
MSSIDSYKRTEVIGQGKFGVVYKGFNVKTKKVVAIKVLELDTQYDEVVDVQQEIQFLADLKNAPNVTHYYGSFLSDTKLWIIMDYCAGGSVRTLLKAGVFEEKYIAVIVRETLLALLAVHKLGVIHRDLKAANILITNEGNVQVCDFGVAAQLSANSLKRTTMAGTPFWMAPDVIREGDQYNVKADIWSLGITVFEIATGNPPYSDKSSNWAMTMIAKLTPPRLEGREYPQALKECIALCLDENPEERPSADELLKCKLVKQYKSMPTSILKELVSRYLLWRDKNSRRDSVFYNMNHDENNEDTSNENQLQVKWDFDSLSSKEYIMDNDIHIKEVEQHFPYLRDDDHEETHDYTLTSQPTHQASTLHPNSKYSSNSNNNTIAQQAYSGNGKPPLGKTAVDQSSNRHPPASPSSNVPKSLRSLFEDDDETSNRDDNIFEDPRLPALASVKDSYRTESPTIEIPDMESLAIMSSTNKEAQKKPSLRIQMPVPNSSVNLMSALTSEDAEKKGILNNASTGHINSENINQFGINPALVGNVTSMTPVAEKDTQLGEPLDVRDLQQRQQASVQKKISAMLGPKTAPISSSNAGGNYFVTRNHPSHSISGGSSISASTTPVSAKQLPRFPQIPTINNDLFSDAFPKAKLTGELELILKLFSQGLDALESSLQERQSNS